MLCMLCIFTYVHTRVYIIHWFVLFSKQRFCYDKTRKSSSHLLQSTYCGGDNTKLQTWGSSFCHYLDYLWCLKSGSLRFSQFSGCWLILSVYIIMSLDFDVFQHCESLFRTLGFIMLGDLLSYRSYMWFELWNLPQVF
jgi:hypothetical protein